MLSRPAVPENWQPAFEIYQERMERGLAFAGAWLLLITVSLYHISHTYFHTHESDPGLMERLFEMPLIGSITLTLVAHWTGFPRWPARYFLRLMGFSLSGLALCLLYFYTHHEPVMVAQLSDSMTIAFFGSSVLALRSFREWLLIVMLPVSIFLVAHVASDHPLITIASAFIGPALIMFVTCMLMAALRKVAVEGFLAREHLNEVATRDSLTRLLNRRAFIPMMQHERERAERSGKPFSVILTDLDRFKRVNDTWGHDAGDQVLRETANRLADGLRQQDVLCRWGGEEFLVLLPETDAKGAIEVAEKCRRIMAEKPIMMGDISHPQTVSLGIATFNSNESVDDLVIRADKALYQAKENGRNRVETSVLPCEGLLQE
jgi:diguanylate cyclase (GGDEF)-like protein